MFNKIKQKLFRLVTMNDMYRWIESVPGKVSVVITQKDSNGKRNKIVMHNIPINAFLVLDKYLFENTCEIYIRLDDADEEGITEMEPEESGDE